MNNHPLVLTPRCPIATRLQNIVTAGFDDEVLLDTETYIEAIKSFTLEPAEGFGL